MKTYSKLFLLMTLFALFQTMQAQVQRVVRIEGITPGVDTLVYDQIYKAITADAPNRAINNNVVYELKRGQVYLATSTILAKDFDLYIRAEDGAGTKPIIFHTKSSSGSSSVFINAQKNLTLENIEFDGKHSDGSVAFRALSFNGLNCRFIMLGCWFTCDLSAGINILVDHAKLYVSDCIFGNLGHHISVGGNGRAIDVRAPNNMDTLIVENSTFYNLTDRFIRNMAPVIDYVKLDHITIANMQGYHGCVQLGKTKKAIITNNLFANPMIYGDRLTARWRSEQKQPDKAFAVITHDSLSTVLPSASVEMRNNNIYFDQKFVDFFNETPPNDSIVYPRAVSNFITKSLGSDLTKAYFTEQLTLTNTSSSDLLLDFVTFWVKYPNAGLYPDNWSQIYPYEWDVSYATTSKSYTAADNGYPVGDLNAFPAMKVKWENGDVLAKSETKTLDNGLEINNYPNPFKYQTTIHYSIVKDQKVEVSIYNSYGQKERILINAFLSEGDYQVSWDGTDDSGSEMPKGMYLVQISGSNGVTTKKILKQ